MHSSIGLIHYLYSYRKQVLCGLLCLLVVDILQLLVPKLSGLALDGLLRTNNPVALQNLSIYTGGMLCIALLLVPFRYYWRYFLFGAARKYRKDVRTTLYKKLVYLPTSFYREKKVGEILSFASNDVDAVMAATSFGVMALADAVFMGVFAILGMFSINTMLTLYALIPFPFLTVFVFLGGRVIHSRFKVVQDFYGILTEKVRESLSNIRVIKAFVAEPYFGKVFNAANNDFYDKNLHLARFSSFYDPTISLLAGFSGIIALLWGGNLVMREILTIGDFLAFTTYLSTLSWPMMAFGLVVNTMQRGSVSAGRITSVLRTQIEPEEDLGGEVFPLSNNLEVKELSYRYTQEKEVALSLPTLDSVSFVLPQGKTLGIMGVTGSGKSTLVNLLLRMLEVPEGKILIGGVDIRRIKLSHYRKHVIVVSQEPLLFADQIRENLLLGRPEASEAELQEVIELVGLKEEVSQFSDGINTVLGERGVTLSGGQRQRLSLARALLADPSILILDDALSAVDAEKERIILENLEAHLDATTRIVISHRVMALKHAHEIIILKAGQILERGSHADLVRNNNLYSQLCSLQQIEKEEGLNL